MSRCKAIIFGFILTCSAISLKAQVIGEFVSYAPGAQTQALKIPCTHDFQLVLKESDVLSDGTNLPGSMDYTVYFPVDSVSGYLLLNHENIAGSVTRHEFSFDPNTQLWNVGQSSYINFTDVVGTYRPCAGGVTPWGTLFSGEEYLSASDLNADGYLDAGWLYEVDPITGVLMDQNGDGLKDKCWSMGRMNHENVCFMDDSLTAYYGADVTSQGFLYKFVADQKGDFSAGSLFVLKKTSLLAPDGVWIPVPNATPDQCDSVSNYAVSIGATNFNRIEEVEIGPDGKIYFAATTNGRIYRLNDVGDSIAQFEIFVNNQTYTVQTESGPVSFAWGAGSDNLAFDPQGNLWVLQDNAFGYILVVGSNHTMANPAIRIFGQSPLGSEPTGITFSEDGNYMFISFQHPTGTNSFVQQDAAGNNVVFNKAVTVVIARKEFLGQQIDAEISSLPADLCLDAAALVLTTNAYTGVFSGAGIAGDSLYVLDAGVGEHGVSFYYADSAGCMLYLSQNYSVHALPDLQFQYDSLYCYYDSVYAVQSNYAGTIFSGLNSDSTGFFNPKLLGEGEHVMYATYTDQFGCEDADSFLVTVSFPNFPAISGLDSLYCKNGLPDTLQLSPISSVFTLSEGMSGFVFSPDLTVSQTVYFEFEFLDSLGCIYSGNAETEIAAPQTNSISGIQLSYCQNSDTIVPILIPAGGLLSGDGVSGDVIIPSLTLTGFNEITYETIDTNGCAFVSAESFLIIAPAFITAGSDELICEHTSIQLNGFPAGGFWSGSFVTSAGYLESDSVGLGIHFYTYEWIDGNGCFVSDTMQLIVDDCLKLAEEKRAIDMLIYPNPAADVTSIHYEILLGAEVAFKISDSFGKTILAENLGHQSPGIYQRIVETNQFSNGVYVITITTNGSEYSKKLIVLGS
jgi:hypothetical protein